MANGDAYRSGFMVFVFLGLAKLFDMATGLNSQIIGYSKYYKFNFYSVMILGLLNTVFNYVLIHRMGISGAALATLISMTLFNVFKLWYVKKKFGIWPFTMKDLYILMITIGLGTMVYFIPAGDNNYVQIIVRSGIFTLLFWAIAIKFDFSPQVSMYFWGVVKRLKGN